MTAIVLGIVAVGIGGVGFYAWSRRRREDSTEPQTRGGRRRRED